MIAQDRPLSVHFRGETPLSGIPVGSKSPTNAQEGPNATP